MLLSSFDFQISFISFRTTVPDQWADSEDHWLLFSFFLLLLFFYFLVDLFVVLADNGNEHVQQQ